MAKDDKREFVGREALGEVLKLIHSEMDEMKPYIAFLMGYVINSISHINLETGMYEVTLPEGYRGPRFQIRDGYLEVVLDDEEHS